MDYRVQLLAPNKTAPTIKMTIFKGATELRGGRSPLVYFNFKLDKARFPSLLICFVMMFAE